MLRSARFRAGLTIVFVWSGAAVFIATQRYLRGPSLQPRLALSWGKALAASGVTAAIWALLTPASMRAARRFRPRRGALVGNLLRLASAGVGASLLHLVATTAFWSVADRSGRGPDFLGTVLATLAFGGAARLATFAAIAGVTWGVDDFRAYRDTELRASELDRELVGAQLETLKLRLQPEFLFHALSTIVPLIRHDPAAAARTVVRLGDIRRSTR
ncbi:MAG: histidine kinase, partial [Syntrophomonadaceae bacterium]